MNCLAGWDTEELFFCCERNCSPTPWIFVSGPLLFRKINCFAAYSDKANHLYGLEVKKNCIFALNLFSTSDLFVIPVLLLATLEATCCFQGAAPGWRRPPQNVGAVSCQLAGAVLLPWPGDPGGNWGGRGQGRRLSSSVPGSFAERKIPLCGPNLPLWLRVGSAHTNGLLLSRKSVAITSSSPPLAYCLPSCFLEKPLSRCLETYTPVLPLLQEGSCLSSLLFLCSRSHLFPSVSVTSTSVLVSPISI